MDEGKTNEASRMAGNQAGEFCIGSCVIVVKEREHDGFVDACRLGAPEIGAELGVRVPRCRHGIPFACVAVKVDDHKRVPALFAAASLPGRGEARKWPAGALASASINQMLV